MKSKSFQLERIAYQQELLAAEGFAHVLRIDPQYLVDEVDDVGPHHRYFIDDDEFHVLDEAAVVGRIFQETVQFASLETEVGIIGQQRVKRQFEKTVQRTSSCIDGSDACRSQYHEFLFGNLADMLQEGRLSGSGLSGQKDGLAGILYQLERILEFRIFCVYRYVCHGSEEITDKDRQR